jgi:hypothetical protein
MHSLEPECNELHAAGVIDDALAARAVALERGTLFSVYEEIRFALYVAVAGITAGIGLVVKNNIDHLGPVALSAGLAVIAAACYASAWRTRLKGRNRGLGGDYVLLLGALVLSADVGYIESQFHWLGVHWSWQLLLLAAFHAGTAYYFDSRLVLSAALAALAGWFGVNAQLGDYFAGEAPLRRSGLHALACAAVILVVRELHRRFGRRDFGEVYEHFAANLAFWGALGLSFAASTRWGGVLLLLVFAALAVRIGLARSREAFVVYGVGYATVGLGVALSATVGDPLVAAVVDLGLVVAAVTLLWRLHRQLRTAGE